MPESPDNIVFVRETFTAVDLLIDERNPIQMSLSDSPVASIEIRRGDSPNLHADCLVALECVAHKKVFAAFRELAEGRLPHGSKEPSMVGPDVETAHTYSPEGSAPLELLPPNVQEFVENARSQLRDISHRAVTLLRWRVGRSGPHNPLRSKLAFQWSLDGQHWKGVKGSLSARLEAVGFLRLSESTRNQVESYLGAGRREPVGHELLREANAQLGANSRSSLAIGIAAVEVGVKQCVAALLPNAEWLISKIPSPPIERILREYLPLIAGERASKHPIPPAALKEIKDGVALRNDLVHLGKSPSFEKLERVLAAVEDVLWILDYYCGEDWSLQYLSEATAKALGLSEDEEHSSPPESPEIASEQNPPSSRQL